MAPVEAFEQILEYLVWPIAMPKMDVAQRQGVRATIFLWVCSAVVEPTWVVQSRLLSREPFPGTQAQDAQGRWGREDRAAFPQPAWRLTPSVMMVKWEACWHESQNL